MDGEQESDNSQAQEDGLCRAQDSGIGEDIGISQTEEEKVLRLITLGEVADHCESRSCWIVLYDYVYDVTEFMMEHPGGMEIILEHAGNDGTVAFKDKNHSIDAHEMLKRYCIGELVESERIYNTDKHL